MSELKNIIVTDFLSRQRQDLIQIEEKIRIIPMTYEQKLIMLESLLRKGIFYGIQKGVFLEQERIKKLKHAKEKSLDRFVDELMFEINHKMAQYRNQPKIKYSKRKYRTRKKHGGTQLVFQFNNAV